MINSQNPQSIPSGFGLGTQQPGLSVPTSFAGNAGTAQSVSGQSSSRYTAFRGLIGPLQAVKSDLVLDSYVDRFTGKTATGRKNYDKQFYNPATAGNCTSKEVAKEFEDYFDEINNYFVSIKNGTSQQNVQSLQLAANNVLQANATTVAVAKNIPSAMNDLLNTYFENSTGQYLPKADAAKGIFQKIVDSTSCDIPNANSSSIANNVPFSFLSDKFTLQKFLEATLLRNQQLTTPTPTTTTPAPVTPEYVYFRKTGVPDKIFTKDNAGNDQEVQAGSEFAQTLKESVACYGTGVAPSNTLSCNNYFMKCLIGQDIDQCKQFMEDPGFWSTAQSAVKTMLPDVLMQTLDAFGFKTYSAITAGGRAFNAYPTAEVWIKTLESQLANDPNAKATVQKVASNSQLMGYLNMIVTRLNANPGIANPTFVEDGPAFNPTAFTGTLATSYNIKPKAYAIKRNLARPAPTPAVVTQAQNTVVNFMSPLGAVFGIVPSGGLRGGGASDLEFDGLEQNLPIQYAGELNNMYESIIENLQEGGKDLDGGDQETIKKMVNELDTLEKKLFKSASYVQGYEDALGTKQSGGNLISEENLEKFTKKRNDYFERVNNKYSTIFPVFIKLAEALEKETITVDDVITSKSYPKYD